MVLLLLPLAPASRSVPAGARFGEEGWWYSPSCQNTLLMIGRISFASYTSVRRSSRPLWRECQLLVVQAEQVQHRRVQVGDAACGRRGAVAEVVGRAVGLAALDAAAGQPDAEAVGVVVAAVAALRAGRAAELAAPEDQRLVEQPRAPGRSSRPATGRSVCSQQRGVPALLLCVSQGWPAMKICTKRTPRSTSRRAIRQRRP